MPFQWVNFKHFGTCGLPASTTPEFPKHDCGDLQAMGAYSSDIDSAMQLKYFSTFFDNIPYKR